MVACTNATRDTTDAPPQSQKKRRATEKVDIVGPWTGLNHETHKVYLSDSYTFYAKLAYMYKC